MILGTWEKKMFSEIFIFTLFIGILVEWSLGHEKKNNFFLFLEIFIFTLFIGIFRFFPYITLVNFCLSVCPRATGHTFWPRDLIFGLSDPWTWEKTIFFLFFEIFIFTLFIGIFRFFPLYNTSKFLSVCLSVRGLQDTPFDLGT